MMNSMELKKYASPVINELVLGNFKINFFLNLEDEYVRRSFLRQPQIYRGKTRQSNLAQLTIVFGHRARINPAVYQISVMFLQHRLTDVVLPAIFSPLRACAV